jgi:glutamate/tyrosine decarboxylase-like PLP-dependent enzyme
MHPEETLDPADWPAFSAAAHQLLDEMIGHVRDIRRQPVWRGVPESVKAGLREIVPEEGQGLAEAYEDFRRYVLPYTYANIHPRAWGWVIGAGTAQSIAHEMCAAALNCNVFGAEQAPNYVEAQVLDWFKAKLGYPPEASGLLVSGASAANLIGLAIARTAIAGGQVGRTGLRGLAKPVTVYCSSEAHFCIAKAVALLGIGTDSLRTIPVDRDFRMSIPDLLSSISQDRRNGYAPLCIVGTAGTTNTGAIDDLPQLAAIAERERVWLHVDGAFGGLLKLSPSLSAMVAGLEKADSIAFDLHKWLHIPHGAGCILTRHPESHRATFFSAAGYHQRHPRGIAAGGTLFTEYGIETSRPFRALKVWLALKEHGFAKYARLIEQNVAQARMLADHLARHPHLRLLSASLNVVCFQFAPAGFPEHSVSELNRELLYRLQETGIAAPTSTELDGRFVIRVAITNHRTTAGDIERLVEEIARIGSELAGDAS